MAIDEFLSMCSYCQGILINKENNLWLKKEDDSKLYELTLKKYEKISHGCCPECESDIAKKNGFEPIIRL